MYISQESLLPLREEWAASSGAGIDIACIWSYYNCTCIVTNFCESFNVVIWDKIAKLNSLQIFNIHIVSCSAMLNVHACITSIGQFYKGDVVH